MANAERNVGFASSFAFECNACASGCEMYTSPQGRRKHSESGGGGTCIQWHPYLQERGNLYTNF